MSGREGITCWFCDELMSSLAIKLHLVRNFYWRAQFSAKCPWQVYISLLKIYALYVHVLHVTEYIDDHSSSITLVASRILIPASILKDGAPKITLLNSLINQLH